MYCSSQLFWFLSSTWWEGKWDAGNGIMPYSPQVTRTRRNMKLTMVSILVKGPNPQDTAGSPFWTTCQPQLLCPWWLQVSRLSSAVPKQILSQHLHRFNRNSDCFFFKVLQWYSHWQTQFIRACGLPTMCLVYCHVAKVCALLSWLWQQQHV